MVNLLTRSYASPRPKLQHRYKLCSAQQPNKTQEKEKCKGKRTHNGQPKIIIRAINAVQGSHFHDINVDNTKYAHVLSKQRWPLDTIIAFHLRKDLNKSQKDL